MNMIYSPLQTDPSDKQTLLIFRSDYSSFVVTPMPQLCQSTLQTHEWKWPHPRPKYPRLCSPKRRWLQTQWTRWGPWSKSGKDSVCPKRLQKRLELPPKSSQPLEFSSWKGESWNFRPSRRIPIIEYLSKLNYKWDQTSFKNNWLLHSVTMATIISVIPTALNPKRLRKVIRNPNPPTNIICTKY